MKEFKAILEAYERIDFGQHRAALATVVRVRGSSYRSPGARMLITDDGHWVGSISGGCLEGDALRKARQVMTGGKGMTVTYDTREESNQNLGIGLGCNGVIDVFIEPVNNDAGDPIHFFRQIVETQEPTVLATVFSHPILVGKKVWMTQPGTFVGADASLPAGLKADMTAIFESRKSEISVYEENGESMEVFLELLQPSINLILFGGGFDARPVSQLAKSLGWNVQVTDECVAHIAPIFFPEADKLSHCHRQFIDREMNITAFTACVLMSHNYEYDRDVLQKLLQTETPYIGILGPRKRFDKMMEEFSKQGFDIPAHQLHRIHSPIGLDIGAEAPDEIAVSIIAEVQSVFANRSGGFLKYRSGPIHRRDESSDQVFKHRYIQGAFQENSDQHQTSK
ncbi:MAG: XdhC family protein [Cyclobacteriaceae bacterium]|nr:XdhC family protein [Cyclobacteriaceae bacterium]